MTPRIVSLGSWCRPAWQIRRYFNNTEANPFDWNITAYKALFPFLDLKFDPDEQLRVENCFVNQLGSVTDGMTGMVYHHDLPAEAVGGSRGSVFMRDDAATMALLVSTRAKFKFLHRRFADQCRSEATVFVRWLREGHPDGEWPQAFEGEQPHALHRALLDFCGHSAIRLVYAVSRATPEADAVSECALDLTSYGANAVLTEVIARYRAESWTGDDEAWSALFGKISENWLGLSTAA